jgi:hypothetical protein
MGAEDSFKPTIGNESTHTIINDIRVRVTNFTTTKIAIVNSTKFPHRNIRKFTWKSRDGKSCYQITIF